MTYQWDPNKAKSNLKKHGVRFADAVSVFEDDNAITIEDEHESENRFITIGRDILWRILVIVYTFRGVIIRIISARKATAHERKMYKEQDEERI
ncbi:MAG: BrnT family toxin [Anaerolineales bacterium]|nr:BrnT family toxin [Anaerolineales bacterium]